jgi:hypothetical protein
VIAFVQMVLRLLADLLLLSALAFRRRRSLEGENLFLRRQLAMYQERRTKPRRIDTATRTSLALLSPLFDWRSALVVVRRVLAKHYRPGGSGTSGPSWLIFIVHMKDSLWSVDLFRCESILLHSPHLITPRGNADWIIE